MLVRHPRPAVALAAWTFLVWTTRIRNIWTDDGLTTGGQIGRTALALAFTAFASATAWMIWRRLDAAGLLRAFAVFTTVVWVVRGVQIATADHDAGFVVVHLVLAVVSIGLAWVAERSASRRPDREPVPTP